MVTSTLKYTWSNLQATMMGPPRYVSLWQRCMVLSSDHECGITNSLRFSVSISSGWASMMRHCSSMTSHLKIQYGAWHMWTTFSWPHPPQRHYHSTSAWTCGKQILNRYARVSTSMLTTARRIPVEFKRKASVRTTPTLRTWRYEASHSNERVKILVQNWLPPLYIHMQAISPARCEHTGSGQQAASSDTLLQTQAGH